MYHGLLSRKVCVYNFRLKFSVQDFAKYVFTSRCKRKENFREISLFYVCIIRIIFRKERPFFLSGYGPRLCYSTPITPIMNFLSPPPFIPCKYICYRIPISIPRPFSNIPVFYLSNNPKSLSMDLLKG